MLISTLSVFRLLPISKHLCTWGSQMTKVVVDYQTMEDQTVTVRDRNTMTQERISIADLKEKLGYAVSMERIFEKLV